MASEAPILSKLITDKVHGHMAGLRGYSGPMSMSNPSYFIEFCTAIGTGISNSSKVINFTTVDAGEGGAPPIPGIGAGVGIFVDQKWFDKELYTEIMKSIKSEFGRTLHDDYPPSPENSGEFLHAVTKGISESVTEHFKTAYLLTSAHPLVLIGRGDIFEGMFSGLVPETVDAMIKSSGPRLKGQFWPILTKAIAKVYVEAIHKHSTSYVTISGICIPSQSQVCGINMVGTGVGTAL